jgi:hypothetical protein
MDSTTTADRRSAHRRVGAAAILAFLALLLLGATDGPAQADPASAPAAAPSVEPYERVPIEPRERPDGGRVGPPGFDGGPGGGVTPAPSTNGNQT